MGQQDCEIIQECQIDEAVIHSIEIEEIVISHLEIQTSCHNSEENSAEQRST